MLKEEKFLLSMESKRVVIVRRPMTENPLHPLSHQHQEVEVRREKGASEAGVRLRRPIGSRAETSSKVLALNYLVTTDILPNVNCISLNGSVNSAQSAHFHTGRLRNNQIKGRRRVVTKIQKQ